MSDLAIWAAMAGSLGLLALALLALLGDGVYQASTGRPSLVPLERIWRHKVPATEVDCVRQGASKILLASAIGCGEAPLAVIGVQSAAGLTGLIPSGPHPPPPAILDAFVFVGIFGPLFVGLILGAAAFLIAARVKYVAAEAQVLGT